MRVWLDIFREDQFIEFSDMKEHDRVINKNDFLREIVEYLQTNYFEGLLGKKKRKSFNLKKNKEMAKEEDHDPSIEYSPLKID